MPRKYTAPSFLAGIVSQEIYERWLRRKAQAHVRRDRKRGNTTAIGESYREAIYSAALESVGRDADTGEALDWSLISQYDNDESKEHGRHYKSGFALLPTVDHVGDGMGVADFKICGWRTNDSKSDLGLPEFLAMCRSVLANHGFGITEPTCRTHSPAEAA